MRIDIDRLTEAELIDLNNRVVARLRFLAEERAHSQMIEFDGDRLGSFQFGAARGWIDYRVGERNGKPVVKFSWEGFNDSDPSSGRGWASEHRRKCCRTSMRG